TGGRLDREQEGQHRAPGVADEREWALVQFGQHRREVLHVRAPGDWRAVVGLGAPAATLVVEQAVAVARELEHLREQVVVVRAGAAVEDHESAARGWRR